MFNIGDVIIYSEHGLCEIDDICDKTIAGVTRKYYILHPLDDVNLQISTPIDNDKVVMLKTMDKEEAELLIQTFNEPGIDWVEDSRQRNLKYSKLIRSGDRNDIANVVNTLIRKNYELKADGKRIYDQDRKLLQTTQTNLFNELALAMNTSFEDIEQKVNEMVVQK